MLTDLRLQHFRSYSDESFEFQPGVNVIVGPNASGKTNLLEAILVLATGSSYRVKDTELIEFNKPWARLDGSLADGQNRTVKLTKEPPQKVYEFAGKTYKRLSLTHTLPVVVFEPTHLQLLTGSPELRRAYLDDLLERTKVGFGTVRRQYKRALAQRNFLLKQTSAKHSLFFPWSVRLSQLAGQIVRSRTDLVADIEKDINNLYTELAGGRTAISLQYLARYPVSNYETSLLGRLEDGINDDRARGFTTAGPHREDFLLRYGGRPANETASRGETRTGVLALKIIELRLLEAARQQAPLLLLDDVFSELDSRRRRTLAEHLSTYQTFITTTDADTILDHPTKNRHLIDLSARRSHPKKSIISKSIK